MLNSMLNREKGLFERLPEKLKSGRKDQIVSKKRRSATHLQQVGPRGVRSSPDLSNSPQTNTSSSFQRAVTFPTKLDTALPRQSVSFDSPRYPATSLADTNSKQNFLELVSPSDMSQVGTPDSNNSNGLQTPFNFQQPFGNNSGLPDLNAMMFPSTDPFAYPNQPMMEFDNRQQKIELMENLLDSSITSNMFLSNNNTTASNTVSNPYDNLEGQLFGPLPPYLLQLQPTDISQLDYQGGLVGGFNQQDLNGHSGLTPNGGLAFDEIFGSGNDDWNNMLADQNVYRQ